MTSPLLDSLKPIHTVLPNGFGYVGLAATGSIWLTVWHMILVGKARKAAGIKYPQMYATKEEQEKSNKALIFNCVQRAHQNTSENLPSFLVSTFLTGLRYPRLAVGFATIWLAGRVLYTNGYSTGRPEDRGFGAMVAAVGLLGLLLSATWTTISLIRETGGQI